jgi:hypothetical protein
MTASTALDMTRVPDWRAGQGDAGQALFDFTADVTNALRASRTDQEVVPVAVEVR